MNTYTAAKITKLVQAESIKVESSSAAGYLDYYDITLAQAIAIVADCSLSMVDGIAVLTCRATHFELEGI